MNIEHFWGALSLFNVRLSYRSCVSFGETNSVARAVSRRVIRKEWSMVRGTGISLHAVGPYEVTGEKLGFKQQVRRSVNLVVGQEAVIDLTLEVGAAAEQVTVTEEA